MAAHEMVAATELLKPLTARGVRLSAVAAWRLVNHNPTRLSLPTLAALCDIFGCSPNDLIVTHGTDATSSDRSGVRQSPT